MFFSIQFIFIKSSFVLFVLFFALLFPHPPTPRQKFRSQIFQFFPLILRKLSKEKFLEVKKKFPKKNPKPREKFGEHFGASGGGNENWMRGEGERFCALDFLSLRFVLVAVRVVVRVVVQVHFAFPLHRRVGADVGPANEKVTFNLKQTKKPLEMRKNR